MIGSERMPSSRETFPTVSIASKQTEIWTTEKDIYDNVLKVFSFFKWLTSKPFSRRLKAQTEYKDRKMAEQLKLVHSIFWEMWALSKVR